MLLYPKPALRLTEADVAGLADVPSPSTSPSPTKIGSRTNAFFSSASVSSPPPKSRTDSFFSSSPSTANPPSPISPSSPPANKSPEQTPKPTAKDVWWAKLARRKRDDIVIDQPILSTSPLQANFTEIDRDLPSPSQETPHQSPLLPQSNPAERPVDLAPGQKLSSNEVDLSLVRPLGKGSFSTVWLARDRSSVPLFIQAKKRARELRKRKSSLWGSAVAPDSTQTNSEHDLSPEAREVDLLRRNSSRKRTTYLALGMPKDAVHGVRPSRLSNSGEQSRAVSVVLDGYSPDGVSRASSTSSVSSIRSKDRLVAVKLVERSALEFSQTSNIMTPEEREKDRTRVSFVREVEVLKHISHPNIAPLLAQLTTPSHHVLVLPNIPGGDLLGLVGNDVAWSKLRESVLQRIFAELVNVVGWMHSVGLVHRDIKLENILLNSTAFVDLTPESEAPTLDLALASCSGATHGRIASSSSSISSMQHHSPVPLIKLTDFGLSRFISPSSPLLRTRCGSEAYAAPELVINGPDGYDARDTDSWACGVCLYELSCRTLPFGSDDESAANRRKWLFKIALGQYTWPESEQECTEAEERMGPTLSTSPDIRRVVSKLLVRDAKQRTAVGDLWDDPWVIWDDIEDRQSISTDGHQTCLDEEMTKITISPSEESGVHCMGHEVQDLFGDDGEVEEWVVDVPEKDSIARQELT